MSQTVELTSFDTRYQAYRMRDDVREARLMTSIAQRGIEQALSGVDTPQSRLLLDGFKRYRCAKKLGIECLPYVSLGDDETLGIASLIRVAKNKPLSILEQAKFVVELLTVHDMSIADVAETLSRSKGWVSMRHSLLKEMSAAVQEILFRGAFPVYSYMYTLRPFMRMNGVGSDEIQRFVQAVTGGRLSVRDIELLAHGYFRGPAALRQEIDHGNWKWSLKQMQAVPEDPEGCNDAERALLQDLERLLKYMQRVMTRCDNQCLQTHAFHAQANLLAASLLSRQESFFKKMEELHDRSGHAECHFPVVPRRNIPAGDQSPPASESPQRAHRHPAAGKDDSQGAK